MPHHWWEASSSEGSRRERRGLHCPHQSRQVGGSACGRSLSVCNVVDDNEKGEGSAAMFASESRGGYPGLSSLMLRCVYRPHFEYAMSDHIPSSESILAGFPLPESKYVVQRVRGFRLLCDGVSITGEEAPLLQQVLGMTEAAAPDHPVQAPTIMQWGRVKPLDRIALALWADPFWALPGERVPPAKARSNHYAGVVQHLAAPSQLRRQYDLSQAAFWRLFGVQVSSSASNYDGGRRMPPALALCIFGLSCGEIEMRWLVSMRERLLQDGGTTMAKEFAGPLRERSGVGCFEFWARFGVSRTSAYQYEAVPNRIPPFLALLLAWHAAVDLPAFEQWRRLMLLERLYPTDNRAT